MNIFKQIHKYLHVHLWKDGKKHFLFSSKSKQGEIHHHPFHAYDGMEALKHGVRLHQELYKEWPYFANAEIDYNKRPK